MGKHIERPECPYQDLYIYYIKGHLESGTRLNGEGFIGNWEEDEFCFLFFSKPAENQIQELLATQSHLVLLDQYCMAYDDWQGGTPRSFKVGRFEIVPPWETGEVLGPGVKKRQRILLDPGVVFGTGSHTTTRNCLEAAELAHELASPNITIDLGTGTGLLALAISGLGCKKTLAIDLNYLAVQTALRNIRLNRLQDKVLAIQGKAEDFMMTRADLLVANIHYDVMKQLIDHRGFLEKKWFILSGLMRSQAMDLATKLRQLPVEIIRKWEQDGIWHTFFGRIWC